MTVGLKPIVALKVGKYALKLRATTWLVIANAIHHTFQSLMTSHSPKRVGDIVAAVEERGACAELAAFVPFAKQKECPREERGLDEAEEEAGKEGADEAIRAW